MPMIAAAMHAFNWHFNDFILRSKGSNSSMSKPPGPYNKCVSPGSFDVLSIMIYYKHLLTLKPLKFFMKTLEAKVFFSI